MWIDNWASNNPHPQKDDISLLARNLNETNKTVKVNYTLYELYKYSETFKKSIYKGICSKSGLDYEVAKNLSREEILSRITDIKSRQIVSEKFDIIDDIVNGEIGSWKVVSYVDNNTIGTKGTAGNSLFVARKRGNFWG